MPATCPYRFERQCISPRCLADKHEMPIRQHFHSSVPGEGLVLAVLRYRHELPHPAHLTSGLRVDVVWRPEDLSTFHGLSRFMPAGECERGCRNGERSEVAEQDHG